MNYDYLVHLEKRAQLLCAHSLSTFYLASLCLAFRLMNKQKKNENRSLIQKMESSERIIFFKIRGAVSKIIQNLRSTIQNTGKKQF